MKRVFLSLFFVLFTGYGVLFAQGRGALGGDRLPLVPYPKEIELGTQDYMPGSRIVVKVSSDEEADLFAASTLAEELVQAEVSVKNSHSGISDVITLTRPGCNKAADRRLEEAGLSLGSAPDPEGYLLLVDDEGVIVSAATSAGVFYGVQTLRQLVYPTEEGYAVRAVAINDAPAMRYRWQQDDWSRGPIPTLEYAKKQIRILSEYKINGYSIYAENLYESKLHPVINPYGGTLTAEEMRELVDYAARYHVEIIPQQQTFGHLHYVLRQERYASLGELHGSQVLSPTESECYDFVNDYLGEIVPMFTSEFIHIGCDETFELGRGKSKQAVADRSHADVYMDHLNRVASLPALAGKKLLFWGEIAVKNPDKLDRLPEQAIAVAWDYLPRDSYEIFLKPYAERNIPTFVAPSAFYGGRVFPDYLSHMKNIRNFVRDGQKFGSMGMLNTSWDDLGEDLFDMGWYGVVYAAACAWQQGESDMDQYRNAFDWAFYRNAENHAYADGINLLADVHGKVGAVNFEMAYSVPFTQIGASLQNHLQRMGVSREMRLWCEDAYTQFSQNRSRVTLHDSTVDALLFAARRLDFVFHKAILASEMSDLYDSFVRNDDAGYEVNTALYGLVMPYASRLGSLRDMTKELKLYHQNLWRQENRPIHWDVVSVRYDRMLLEWELEYDRIQLDVQQAGSGTHLPREKVGFRFDSLNN